MIKGFKSRAAIFAATVFYTLSAVFFSSPLFACSDRADALPDGLSVRFIDVGEGDCAFVYFPDGKTALIDCGLNDDKGKVYKKISGSLDEFAVQSLDYLIITHVDSDHAGNLARIARDYKVKKAFLPYTVYKDAYPWFKDGCDALSECGAETEVSDIYDSISGDGYSMVFLSPSPVDFSDGEYDEFNRSDNPSSTARNAVSPIIYLEYSGVRFLFTGDAEKKAQKSVYDKYALGLYDYLGVNLADIDFFKVPHHGAADAVCDELWTLLRCKNAVVSASADNFYAHPSDYALLSLVNFSPAHELFRTDVSGNISVTVNDGNVSTVTEK